MAIKAIIFDVGGVIYPNRLDLVREGVEGIGLEYEEFKRCFDVHWDDYKIGRIKKEEFWAKTLTYLGRNPSKENIYEISEIQKRVWQEPDKSMIKLITNLRNKYTVLCLTNICDEYAEVIERDNIQQFFSKVYMSHRLEMKKPDTKIYLHVLDDNNLKPEEAVFIDDKPINIESAARLGIQAIRFTGRIHLKQRLKEMEII